MRVFYSTTAVLFLSLLVPVVAFGQAAIRGTVTDATVGETLIGVNVIVQGTSLGAATDIEGQYRILGIPERVLNVKISCLGYEAQIIEIDFSKTKDVQKNIKMKPQVIQGEEVVVTAQMRGQLAAINQQITSNTIINVISEEKIQELPDANAAEAIGRLPGVSIVRSGGEATQIVLRGLSSKFSNITIDGVRIPATDPNTRDIDLSTISQGSLAGVELYKTLTPDQDADAIAGAVNLVTKKAPSERSVNIDLKGDYNHLMKSSKQYDFLVRYGERFFDDVLGIQIQGNTESKIRSNEYVSTGYSELRVEVPSDAPFADDYSISTFTTRFTDETRKRNGAQVIFDINTPDSGVVKLSGVYSGTNRNIMLYSRVYPTSVTNNYWDYTYQYRELGIQTFNSSLQGKNYLLGLDLDWSLSYAHSKTDNPYDYTLTFTDPSGGAVQATRDHPEINIIPFASKDFTSPYCSTAVYLRQENFDKERTAHVNISKKYRLSDFISGDVKVGGKYKERVRWMDNEELDDNTYLHSFYFDNKDGSSKNYVGTRFENYAATRPGNKPQLDDFFNYPVSSRSLLGLYEMTPLIDVDALKEWYTLNKNGAYGGTSEYVSSDRADLVDYSVTERIAAGYLMNSLNLGTSFTIIAGVRMEKEVNDYYAKYAAGGIQNIGIILTVLDAELKKDSTTSYAETIWLPNIQLTIKPTEYFTIRMAAYKALARPDYNYRLPRFYIYGSILNVGNPNLKSVQAWNYEINTQVFNNTIGLISVSGFYKVIDNLFHEMQNVNLTTNSPVYGRPFDSLSTAIGLTWQNDPSLRKIMDFSALTFTAPYNSTSPSYAWGIEFEHQMNFSSLPIPAFLRNITLSYNVSITRSETNVVLGYTQVDTTQEFRVRPGTSDTSWVTRITNTLLAKSITRQSEGQPKLYCNAALGYDIGGFSARLSVFYQDEYVRQYSANGNADIIVNSFTKWDLAFKQEVTKYLSLFLNINNLTNIQESTLRRNNIMIWNLPRTAELYGTTVDFGVRLSL